MGRKKKIDNDAGVEPEETGQGFVVAKPFRDIKDFSKKWMPGDDVSHFDWKRLERLAENGMVVKKQK